MVGKSSLDRRSVWVTTESTQYATDTCDGEHDQVSQLKQRLTLEKKSDGGQGAHPNKNKNACELRFLPGRSTAASNGEHHLWKYCHKAPYDDADAKNEH